LRGAGTWSLAVAYPCEKLLFGAILYQNVLKRTKTIILPRQAQDKHRENSKKKAFWAGESDRELHMDFRGWNLPLPR
jgi:hypothetical protein